MLDVVFEYSASFPDSVTLASIKALLFPPFGREKFHLSSSSNIFAAFRGPREVKVVEEAASVLARLLFLCHLYLF